MHLHLSAVRFAALLSLLAAQGGALASAQTTVREIWGAANGYEYGASITPTSDVNSDGTADFLVGSPGWLGGRGGVSIVSGRHLRYGVNPISVMLLDIQNGLSPAMWEVGASVASIGNLGFNSQDEIVIGGPGSGPGYIACISPAASSVPLTTIVGEGAGDRFGAALAATGDVNLDGYVDVLVGAPLHDGYGADAGTAYLISGRYLALQTGAVTIQKFSALADGGQTGQDRKSTRLNSSHT